MVVVGVVVDAVLMSAVVGVGGIGAGVGAGSVGFGVPVGACVLVSVITFVVVGVDVNSGVGVEGGGVGNVVIVVGVDGVVFGGVGVGFGFAAGVGASASSFISRTSCARHDVNHRYIRPSTQLHTSPLLLSLHITNHAPVLPAGSYVDVHAGNGGKAGQGVPRRCPRRALWQAVLPHGRKNCECQAEGNRSGGRTKGSVRW